MIMKHPLTTHDKLCLSVVDKLSNQHTLMSRKDIAQAIGVSKPTATTILNRLIDEGAIIQTKIKQKKQSYFAYELAPIFHEVNDIKIEEPPIIRRKDGQYAMYCPSCKAYVRYRWDKYVYVYNCRCGYHRFMEDMGNG